MSIDTTTPSRLFRASPRPGSPPLSTGRRCRSLVIGAGLMVFASSSHAASYGDFSSLTQDQFRLVAGDLGKALSWKGIVPAETLGVLGFDVGVGLNVTSMKNAGLLNRTAGGDGPSTFWVPSIRAHKGLPLGIDIGATYGKVLGTNLSVWSAEARYAIVRGNPLIPAVAVRLATAGLSGAESLSLQSTSAELSVSKGIANFTPYAGLGQVWSTATPRNAPALQKESFSNTRYYVGLNVNLGRNLAVELGRTGGETTVGMKTGFRFASWI